MYIPEGTRVDDTALLHELMRQYSFATLVTTDDDRPFASHLPFLVDAERGPQGTLRAHMARANPQWRHFESGREALVMFQGPHAYISPAWYEHQPSVPTWNYAVVHAYGRPRLTDDEELFALVHELTVQYEGSPEAAARLDMPDEYVRKLMRGIVGFEIEITRLEGKFKLGQNRPEGDRKRVIAALQETVVPLNADTAAWMREAGQRHSS